MFYNHKNGVSFRKVEESDLSDLKSLKDESWFGTVNTACLNMADQKRWFDKIAGDKSCAFFIAGVSGYHAMGLFGLTALDPVSHCGEFTHSVYKNSRGKGLGKLTLEAGIDMAFEVFNIRRIETWILENNTAEAKSTLAVGFIEEGVRRKAVYKSGEYLNCKLYGLLRDEWQQTKRVVNLGKYCNLSYLPKTSKSVEG